MVDYKQLLICREELCSSGRAAGTRKPQFWKSQKKEEKMFWSVAGSLIVLALAIWATLSCLNAKRTPMLSAYTLLSVVVAAASCFWLFRSLIWSNSSLVMLVGVGSLIVSLLATVFAVILLWIVITDLVPATIHFRRTFGSWPPLNQESRNLLHEIVWQELSRRAQALSSCYGFENNILKINPPRNIKDLRVRRQELKQARRQIKDAKKEFWRQAHWPAKFFEYRVKDSYKDHILP